MQSLGAEAGLRSIDEPFGPKFVYRSYLARFPELAQIAHGHRLFDFPPSLVPRVQEYMREPGHTAICGPYNPFLPSYHLFTNRRLWKIIHANPAIEFFLRWAQEFHTFLLIRHPCPTILSMSKKYPAELATILAYQPFCAAYLSNRQFGLFKDIERGGTLLEKFAAEWALEQLVPWQVLPRYRGACEVISYEQLRLDPRRSLMHLATYCQLDQLDAIVRASNIPSASTADERLGYISSATAMDSLRSWRREIDEDMERRVFEIIDIVGIDYYEKGRDRPTQGYLIRTEKL